MGKLTGKLCIVTGAGQGIGAAIVKAFANEGATVVVTDVNIESASKVAESIGANAVQLDVTSEDDWQDLSKRYPEINVLVNNAGITGFEQDPINSDQPAAHDPENASLKDWRRVHEVNLDGTFLGCRYAIKAMRKNGSGSIINISSRSGMIGIPMAAAYASSKAAVRNHTKSVALYCAQNKLNIRCNSIHPAAVLTPMWEPMLGNGEDRKQRMAAIVSDTPLKRFGTPEEVAAIALLLASDDANYMTGTELTIDGGILAGAVAAPSQD